MTFVCAAAGGESWGYPVISTGHYLERSTLDSNWSECAEISGTSLA